ncbi:hypothetical protein D3C78_990350 [compost metagenome]
MLILSSIISCKGNGYIGYREGQLPPYFVVLIILHRVRLLLVGPVARHIDVTGNAAVFLFSFQYFAELVLQGTHILQLIFGEVCDTIIQLLFFLHIKVRKGLCSRQAYRAHKQRIAVQLQQLIIS